MALNLLTTYPGQIATDAAYPYGKPRNRSVPGEKDGTPLEESWVSDVYGFLQSLLSEAGLVPTNVADTASSSQYLEGLQWQIGHILSNVGDNGEHVYIKSGSWLSFLSGSHGTVYGGAYLSVSASAYLYIDGYFQVRSGGSTTWIAGSQVNWNDGSNATLSGDVLVSASSSWTIAGELTWGASNYPKLSSRSLTRVARAAWCTDANTTLLFDSGSGAGQFWGALLYQGAASVRETIESSATVTSVVVYVKGAAHGGSWPPAGGMPTLTLTKVSHTSGTTTVLGTTTDSSAQSPYEDWHPLIISLSPGVTFAEYEKLLISLTSEYGATGVVAPMEFKDPLITMTFDELRPV
jgi:hypothetical protein